MGSPVIFKGQYAKFLTKGVQIPSLTTAQRTALTNLVDGTMVYDSDLDYIYTYQAGSWTSSATLQSSSYELSNLGLSVSVAANALTIALKQADGTSDPAAGASAVKVGFRSSTLTSGLYNQRSVTSALSLVVPSGATLGSANNVAQEYFVYLIDNAGTVELAVSSTYYPDMGPRITVEGASGIFTATTAIGTASNSGDIIYSTTARTNIPFRLIGKFIVTQATAGTWATAPASVTLVPFEFTGYNVNTSTAAAFVTSGVYRSLTDANIPLTPGVYELGGSAEVFRTAGISDATAYTAFWSEASGAATAFSGTNISRMAGYETAVRIQFNTTQELDAFYASMTSVIVQVKNTATVYAVDKIDAGTPANFTSSIALYVKRLQ